MIEIKTPTQGIVGYLHEVECTTDDSVLIFQLPRRTDMISKGYIESARAALKESLPTNRNTLIMGCDVNVYELFGADAVIMKLKGII